jgi:hypothetical protein
MGKVHFAGLTIFWVLTSALATSARADTTDDILAQVGASGIGDGTGVRLLMIGDSHSAGKFGFTVDHALRKALPKAKVTFYAASSATPDYYYYGTSSHGGFYQHYAGEHESESTKDLPDQPTPKLTELLAQSKATVTVVALSTNLLRGSLDGARAQILKTIKTIKSRGSQCIWVGGPDERFVSRDVQEELYKILKSATDEGGCTLIDSRSYTHYPDVGGKGIHYDEIWEPDCNGKLVHTGPGLAADWGKKVTGRILGAIGGLGEGAVGGSK